MTTEQYGESKLMREIRCCEYCDDGSGQSMFPHYGVAPHNCNGFDKIGTATVKPDSEWPDDFIVDKETVNEGSSYPPCGTYASCPYCGGCSVDYDELMKADYFEKKNDNPELLEGSNDG